MKNTNIAIAWNWEYDDDFLSAIERECRRRDLSVTRIDSSSLVENLRALTNRSLSFDVLFDRASDSDHNFLPLISILRESSTRFFNDFELAERSRDKATMHLELMSHGLYVPYTLITSSYEVQSHLTLQESELELLGIPFVIKPANTTGGGIGVQMDARSLGDIQAARKEYPHDKFLVQQRIVPKMIGTKRAWFRVFYAFGEVIPCWWSDETHIYEEISIDEELLLGLTPLRNYMHTIYKVCRLDFFSSEIALTNENLFVVVDYVNEVCDMRLQSQCVDGVPDAIVDRIACLLVNEAEITLHRSPVID